MYILIQEMVFADYCLNIWNIVAVLLWRDAMCQQYCRHAFKELLLLYVVH